MKRHDSALKKCIKNYKLSKKEQFYQFQDWDEINAKRKWKLANLACRRILFTENSWWLEVSTRAESFSKTNTVGYSTLPLVTRTQCEGNNIMWFSVSYTRFEPANFLVKTVILIGTFVYHDDVSTKWAKNNPPNLHPAPPRPHP